MSEPKLTQRQAAIIGAYTGVLVGPFSEMHEYIEEILDRPVQTMEMAMDSVVHEIQDASRADLMTLIREKP